MSPELEIIKAVAPALLNVIAMIAVIAYTKKALFSDMIPKNLYDDQVKRESEAVGSIKETAMHLEEIGRQLENFIRTMSEELKDHSEIIKDLAGQCEKHRKQIPDTEVFLQQRKK
jgi:hypothetical protein